MYKCYSHTWEREFTDFNWFVSALFIDRANNQSVISIQFQSKVRFLYTGLDIDTGQKAIDYAKTILADEIISEQDPNIVVVSETTIQDKYIAWREFGQQLIIEFNAQSSTLDTGTSDLVLSYLQNVLNALQGSAIGVARKRLNDLSPVPYFPIEVKTYWLNRIDEYLARW